MDYRPTSHRYPTTFVPNKTLIYMLCIVIWALPALAQSPPSNHMPGEPQPIQDNIFLIEEAYNQEEGVVQHINEFIHTWHHNQWLYTFTQEWPVGSQQHQVSYTIPVQRVDTTSGE